MKTSVSGCPLGAHGWRRVRNNWEAFVSRRSLVFCLSCALEDALGLCLHLRDVQELPAVAAKLYMSSKQVVSLSVKWSHLLQGIRRPERRRDMRRPRFFRKASR